LQTGTSLPKAKSRRRRPAWGKIAFAALVMVALAVLWRYTPVSEYFTAHRVAEWARVVRETSWAPVIVVLAYTPAAFVMFPRPVLTLFTVIAFGPWLGFTYGMLGIMGAALATYYAGRVLRHDTVQRVAGDKLDEMTPVLRRHGLLAVLAVRVVAVAPFAVEGVIAGAVRIRLSDYMLGTAVGMTPGVLATTVFGNQISRALQDPSTINWWLIGSVAVAFIVLTFLVGRWFATLRN
jgi:phospholipase D1/2